MGSGPHTALLANPLPPASSPHGSRPPAQAWHPAQPVKHPELDMSGSVGPRAASPASALCLGQRPRARGAPRLAAPLAWPASYSLQLGNIPLHELTVSMGTRPSGEGAWLPLSAGLGWGCRGVGVGDRWPSVSAPLSGGRSGQGPYPRRPRHCAEPEGPAQFEELGIFAPLIKGETGGPEWGV